MYTIYKDLWIKALRSGEYKQGRGTLKFTLSNKEPEYCCLGVLCEIAYSRDKNFINGNAGTLTAESLRYFNMSQQNQNYLMNLNDGLKNQEEKGIIRKHNFAEIADYIENKL